MCTMVAYSAVCACMHCGAECTRLGGDVERVSGQNLPVVKHALWKGLTTMLEQRSVAQHAARKRERER